MATTATNSPSETALECLQGSDWSLLESKSTRVRFRAGEAMISRGAPVNRLFVIRSGVARVAVTIGAAVAHLKSGDICGEMGFLEQCPASAWVIAESDVEADAFDTAELQELFTSFPNVGARFYKSLAMVLSRRLRLTTARLAQSSNSK